MRESAYSSNQRARARAAMSRGYSAGAGWRSSRYSQMTDESASTSVTVLQDGNAPQRRQLREALVAHERDDGIDLVRDALQVQRHEHLAHVGRQIAADDR